MLEWLWLAGDIWRESWLIRWSSYLCLGVIIYIFGLRYFVSRQLFSQIKHQLSRQIAQTEKTDLNPLKVKPVPEKVLFKPLYKAYALSQISWPWSRIWYSAAFLTLIGLCLVYIQTRSWLFTLSVPGFVFGAVALLIYLKSLDQRQKLVEQIPLFLQAMSNSLQAGYTLPMALEFIADEMEMPLKREIQIINQQLSLQISLADALESFAQKIKNPEVDFFVESTLIQIKTGGNLIKLFDKIAFLIEEKLKLKRDIRSFTSQGKLSGILIATLWPVSVLAFSWLSPTHTEVLFHTPGGQIILVLSLILEILGFFFIWKIISVKL